MNVPKSTNKFVPRQALAPTPQLYGELVGDAGTRLASATFSQIPPIQTGSVIHDNACGIGAGTTAIMDYISGSKEKIEVLIKGTDINENAVEVYKKEAEEKKWPVEAKVMDSVKLEFEDDTFDYSLGSMMVFIIPDDGVEGVKEMYRTLKPGGTMLVNCWAYVPNMAPIHTASLATRPKGTPLPRDGAQKWSDPTFLRSVVEKGGFSPDKITMKKAEVYVTVQEFTRYATMLWSFIGGTSEVGWLESDEDNWDEAIKVVVEELRNSEGFVEEGEGGQLRFVTNIAVAVK